MTTYSVRCKNSKCRHRRVLTKHPDAYKKAPRCVVCGEDKGWRIEDRAWSRRDRCYCSLVVGERGTYPHKRGGHPTCEHHPQGPYNHAKRQGVADDDIPLEHLGVQMKETDDCPF